MDPASAIISIVSFGFTVLKKINDVRKDVKGAPEQVRSLQQLCVSIQLLLTTLDTTKSHTTPYAPEATPHLQCLCASARECLEEVNTIIRKVTTQSASTSTGALASVTPKVSLKRWLMKKNDFDDASKKLRELRDTLTVMVNYMHSHSLEFIVVKLNASASDCEIRNDLQTTTPLTEPPASSTPIDPPRHCGPLRCPPDCSCRCHAKAVSAVIPRRLAPYIGQVYVSKQLLDLVTYRPLMRCNVPTCRGDFLKPATVSWFLPPWFLHGQLRSSSNNRIHFSINAPRTVAYSSPIIQVIWSADIHALRGLFALQKASIWDVDIRGHSVLWHACREWQYDHSEIRLDIIRFLVEAGADTLLFAGTETSSSAHDLLAIGLFQHILGEPDQNRSLATVIQTNSAAVQIFRSLFSMDAIDALDDLLSRYYGHAEADVSRLLNLLQTTEHTVVRSSVFNAIRYTPLEYAIRFSPSKASSGVELLLAGGADASAEPTLAYAVHVGRAYLIELLVANGADVNMKDSSGQTALHWTCSRCYYDGFFELLRWAGDVIDWDAPTLDGQSVFDLFEVGVIKGQASDLTATQINKFRCAIVSHLNPSRLPGFEEPLHMPGTFSVTT